MIRGYFALKGLPGLWQFWAGAGDETTCWVVPIEDPKAQLTAAGDAGLPITQGCVLISREQVRFPSAGEPSTLF